MDYFTCNTYNKGRTRNGWVLKSLVLGQGRHPAPPGRVVVWCRRDRLWQSPSRSHIVGQAMFFCNKPLKKSILKKISAEECYGQHYAVISLANPGPRLVSSVGISIKAILCRLYILCCPMFMVWVGRDLENWFVSTPLPWKGTPSTRTCCFKLHPTWR